MKKFKTLLLLLLCSLLFGALAACGGSETYTVTFETYGGTQIEPYTLEEGDEIARPQDPSKALFTFGGWYSDEACTQEFDFSRKMPENDLTVYARWISQTSSRVEYDSMGGSPVPSSVGAVGSAFTPPQDPVREGYRFGGWYKDAACLDPFYFTTYPEESLTLYAQWLDDPAAYAYIEYVGNGRQLARVPVKKGTTVAAPQLSDLFGDEADGIVLDGWYRNDTLTGAYTFGAVSSNVTLYAAYYSAGMKIADGAVTEYRGDSAHVYVPNRFAGSPVVSVGSSAFAGNDSVVTVDLPSTIVSVGESAFYRCRYLDQINLTRAVTSLGRYAFFDCNRLTDYGDITGVTNIGTGTFLGCEKLGAVTLSENAASLGEQAFADCKMLTEVSIPDGVTSIGSGLFDGCVSLAKVKLPARLATLGERVFAGCEKLTELTLASANTAFRVEAGKLYRGTTLLYYTQGAEGEKQFTIPESVTAIADGAFDGNSTLESVTVQNGNAVINRGAFSGMKSLVSLTLPGLGGNGGYLGYYFGAEQVQTSGNYSLVIPETLQSVTLTEEPTSVGNYAFYGAAGLREVNGLGSVVSVGTKAFAFTSLRSFTVAPSLVSIGDLAFEGCRMLEEYVMSAPSTDYSVCDGCLYNGNGTQLIAVPAAKKSVSFAPTVTSIASYAFSDSAVETVAIPDSVTEIGEGAFNRCFALSELTVPFIGDGSSNDYLGFIFGVQLVVAERTEADGTQYREVPEPDGLSLLPTSLAKVTVNRAYPALPDAAFAYFGGLREVVLGGNVQTYGVACFYRTALPAWDLTGAQTVGDYAFALTALTSVSIPATVQTLGYASFSQLSSVEQIAFAADGALREIGPRAFYAYAVDNSSADIGVAFTSRMNSAVVIPASVQKIGSNAFYGLGMLFDGSRYNMPNAGVSVRFAVNAQGVSSLTEIGSGAFAHSALRSVQIPASVQKLGAEAFRYCGSLTEVTFGTNAQKAEGALEELGELCFADCTSFTSLTMYVRSVVTMNVRAGSGAQGAADIFYGAAEGFVIRVPQEVLSAFKSANGWRTYANRIFAAVSEGGAL